MSLFRTARAGWLLTAIALLVYAFLYDNATSMPNAMGYGWTRLTPLSRQVRLLEIVVIVLVLGLALSHGVSRITRTLMIGILLFVGLGLMSFLSGADVPLVDGVRLIYMWVLPLFIFIIGREGPWRRDAWKWIATTVLVWVAVSAVISWIQFALLGYPVGDDITGFNKDAHANGTLCMLSALQLLAFGLFFEKRAALFGALALLVTMVLSSVLKVMFLGVVAVALLIWLYLRTTRQRRSGVTPHALKWGMSIAAAVVLVGVAFSQVDVLSSDRLGDLGDKVRNDPQSLGPWRAHESALGKIDKDLSTLALGMGPFRFANPISVGQITTAGRLSRSASGEVLAIADEKGEETRITLSSSLLAEFGVPAWIVAAILYFTVGRALWRAANHDSLDIRGRAAGLVAAGSILFLIPLTSLFGSFDVISVSWPMMLLSGILCREAARSDAGPAGALARADVR
jgi:hypothetical protein